MPIQRQNDSRRSLSSKLPWSTISTVLLLIAIYFASVAVRTQSFLAQGQDHRQQFWVESAQHFRNVEMVANGKEIPMQDIDLEYPNGLMTRTHTVHGEYLIGYLSRIIPYKSIVSTLDDLLAAKGVARNIAMLFLPMDSPDLTGFVRYFVRYANSLIVFSLFLVTLHFSRSRSLGFLAAGLYAFSFPAVSRALGDTFYHEHVALPCLSFHLYFLIRALDDSRWRDLVLGWFFLFLALLFWKVIGFYALALNGYFAVSFLLNRMCSCKTRFLLISTLGNLLTSIFLNIHLHYDKYWQSPTMICAYGILLGVFIQSRLQTRKYIYGSLTFSIVVFGLLALTPKDNRYAHVWETLFAKLHYWSKPLDPSLLSYEARHYWVEPYTSPALFWFILEIAPWLLLGLYPVIRISRRILRNELEHGKEVWLFLTVCFFCFYLLFFKMKTFAAIFFPPLIALPFSQISVMHLWDKPLAKTWAYTVAGIFGGLLIFYLMFFPFSLAFSRMPTIGMKLALQWPYSGEAALLTLVLIFAASFAAALVARSETIAIPYRRPIIALVFASLVMFSQGYMTLSWNRSVVALTLDSLGLKHETAKRYTRVTSAQSVPQLMEWIEKNTKKNEAFLSEFVLSPTILTYAHRPVNQHCFFECDMREKFRQFVERFFQPEEKMYEFCRKYQTTYLVYNAHILLRDDPEMSFRYIANQMGWDENWLAYQMEFRPETLKHFRLAFQNPFFRVYRVLAPDEKPGDPPLFRFSPLFSEDIFKHSAPKNASGERDPSAFLYSMVEAYDLYDQAMSALQSPYSTKQGLALLKESMTKSDLIPEAHTLAGQALMRAGDNSDAQAHFKRTLELNPSDPIAKRFLTETPSSHK